MNRSAPFIQAPQSHARPRQGLPLKTKQSQSPLQLRANYFASAGQNRHRLT